MPELDQVIEEFYEALFEDDPEQLYDSAPCGYLSTTPDGTIVKVNQTFLALTGYQRDDLVGRQTFAGLLTGGGRIYHETHYAPMLRMQGTAREIALEIVRADGTRLPALVNAVLVRDAAGEPHVIRAAVFDATDRRRYETELLRAKERAEASEARALSLARTLQQTLMPPTVPAVPGIDLAVAYHAAGDGGEVGGDFYDVFETADGDWFITVGDVCGKGVEAAVVASLARHTIRAAAVRLQPPSHVLSVLNEVLLGHDPPRFCTAVLIRLGCAEGAIHEATIATGGHPLPLVRPAGTAEPTVAGEPGSLIGAFAEATFADVVVPLSGGDELLVYTDGVTEARRGSAWFGEERLWESVRRHGRHGAEALAKGVLGDVVDFQHGDPRDDIALVAIAVPG